MPQFNNKDKGGLTLKVSEKGGVSLYGMGRFRSRTKKNTDSAACRSHVFGTVSAIAAIFATMRKAAPPRRVWKLSSKTQSVMHRSLNSRSQSLFLRSMNLDALGIARPHSRRTLQDSSRSARIAKRAAEQILRLDRMQRT
jgi:hypothetical protein